MAYLYTFYPDVPPLVQSRCGWGLGWRFCSEVAWLYMYKLQVSVALQSFRLRPVRLRARSCWYMSNWYINNSLHLARKYARIFVHGHYLFREAKTVSFEEPIMSKDKYPSIFSQPNWGYCVYYPSVLKIGEYPRIFPSFRWGIFSHVTRLDQSHASENIWWIITSDIPQF